MVTVVTVVAVAVAFAAGFGAGRIKNAAKLKDIAVELSFFEATAVADVKAVIAAIRSHI